MRAMRGLLLAAVLSATLVAAASAASPVRVAMTTSTAKPLVDTPWRYTITAKDAKGKPVAAKARLHILVGQTVVGCWKGTAMMQCQGAASGTWIRFTGRRTGVLTWPAQSVGVTLTFQATVVVGGRATRLRAPVTVQPS
jgi:hypothetical protein